jgi:glyoxylase-like metal-dependent hydrolase (beta-lactamase superfamily II)
VDFRILHDTSGRELSYLLADRQAGEALLIDPRGRDLPVIQALLQEKRLTLRWVLRTHHHDHLQPMEFARLRQLGAPVVQGEVRDGARTAHNGEQLDFGRERVQVWATPGHTVHCLSFVWRDRVFCGGLLALDACPLQPYPADAAALWDSVTRRLFSLPDETLLFAGHEVPLQAVTSVWAQRRTHPWFARLDRDAFITRWSRLDSYSDPNRVSLNRPGAIHPGWPATDCVPPTRGCISAARGVELTLSSPCSRSTLQVHGLVCSDAM